MTPTDKMAASGAAGVLSILLAWLVELAAIPMPPQVQVAVVVALMWAAGYIKTERGALAAALARGKGPTGEHSAG